MAESENNGDSDLAAAAAAANVGRPYRVKGGRNKSAAGAPSTWVAAAFLCVAFVVVLPQSCGTAGARLYTNTFAVKLHGAAAADGHVDETTAHLVAKRAGSGFENVGKVRTAATASHWPPPRTHAAVSQTFPAVFDSIPAYCEGSLL